MKLCIECGVEILGKRTDTCKACRKKQGDKRYYAKHKTKLAEYRHNWYMANKERVSKLGKRRQLAKALEALKNAE